MIPRRISNLKWRLGMALTLGAVLALVLSANAAAAPAFPQIKRGEFSCFFLPPNFIQEIAFTVTWHRADRRGKHKGHAEALFAGDRRGSSKRLRRVRSQSIDYRKSFPERFDLHSCLGPAKVVASHGQNKDGKGLVEIYRVTRKGIRGSGNGGSEGGNEGADCLRGGRHVLVKAGAQLKLCPLSGANLNRANLKDANLKDTRLRHADLSNANLKGANLRRAKFGTEFGKPANLERANLTDANLTDAGLRSTRLKGATLNVARLKGANLFDANLSSADLTSANLTSANLFVADLTGADLTGADLSSADLTSADLTSANFTDANCWGAKKPDGSMYPGGSGPFFFVPC